MKKLILPFIALAISLAGCQKKEVNADFEENESSQFIERRACGTQEVFERQVKEDPSFLQRVNEIEAFTQKAIKEKSSFRLLPDGSIEIPVVVNVLYRTNAQNISLSQIQSQIDVLNEDFGATNADYNSTPSLFQGVRSGNTNIRFVLDQVVRKATNKTSWSTNNAIKKSSQGGIDPTSPTTKLNMWSGNLGNGLLGYAQFPGGPSSTDGVVIDDNAFGRTGSVTAPFNKGRTATHEVGHWLNLRHIWGDATCGNDQVSDTPPHNTANYGCPTYPHLSTCSGTPVEMTMNYMDYTDDACMYMFTAGQKARMQATFGSGGGRNTFAQP